MRFPSYLKYLHEKTLPRNPLWYPGNPQHRIFLPLYWLKLVESDKKMPKDFVKFECHWQMTSSDVKQYLEKLYKVPVLDVRIEIVRGEYMVHPKRPGLLSPPMDDRKYAYIQLKDATFEFPKIIDEDFSTKIEKEIKVFDNLAKKEKNKTLSRFDVGSWFQ